MNKEKKQKIKIKERIKTILIIVLIIIILILLLRGCGELGLHTAVIEENTQVDLQDTSSGKIRIKMSPQVNIKQGTMQDLEFCNYNEDRLLKIRIVNERKKIYESQMIKAGDILVGDWINTDTLKKGYNDVTAEIYSYNMDKKLMGQTNVNFILNYIS